MSIKNKSIQAMIRIYTPGILAGLVGIVFILAALIKSTDMELFIRQIRAYDIISSHILIALSAWGFIVIELVLGAGLITAYRQKIILPATAFILIFFMLVNLYALLKGSTSDCGCFGSVLERTPRETILEDLVLFLFVLVAWFMGIKPWFGEKNYPLYILVISLLAGIFLPVLFGFSPLSVTYPDTENTKRYMEKLNALTNENMDINHGDHLIVLMSTGCIECRESVFDLDIIADMEEMPYVVALCSDTEEQISEFREELQPIYAVIKINENDFYQLLGNGELPRIILLKKGEVVRIWDHTVPDTGEIKNTLDSN